MHRIAASLLLALGLGLAAPVDVAALPADEAASYREALGLADRGDYDRALAAAGGSERELVARLVQWRRLMRDDGGVAFHELAEFLYAHPDWPGRTSLRRAAERKMPDHMPLEQQIGWFTAFEPLTGEGRLRYALALRAAGQHAQAVEVARKAWVDHDLNADQEAALLDAFGEDLAAIDHQRRFERLLAEERREPAMRMARRLGEGYERLAEARLRLAARQPGVDAAVLAVPDRLQSHHGLIFERARWRLRSDMYDGAIELLDPAPQDVVLPDVWWNLRHWAARRALREGDAQIAYRLAADHGMESGVGFAEAEFLAGWLALRFLDDADLAYRHFDRLYHGVSTPISRSRGAYWAGEAAAAIGRDDWAAQWYRVAAVHVSTFYGQLAALRLGVVPAGAGAPPPQIGAEARAAFAADELVRAVRLLDAIDRDDLVGPFFAALRLRAQTAAGYWQIAELARDLGRTEEAVYTARMAATQGFVFEDHLFPQPQLGVEGDPLAALILGLIRQESAFNQQAVSRVGARGLMQLMPGTAEQMARAVGESYDLARLTQDPDYNLRLGRAYLTRMLERYDGYLPLALAAYNAGPGRASQWIQEYGDPRDPMVDPVDWIESIPFRETRSYVQRVLEAMTVYGRRLDPQGDPFGALPRPLPAAYQQSVR